MRDERSDSEDDDEAGPLLLDTRPAARAGGSADAGRVGKSTRGVAWLRKHRLAVGAAVAIPLVCTAAWQSVAVASFTWQSWATIALTLEALLLMANNLPPGLSVSPSLPPCLSLTGHDQCIVVRQLTSLSKQTS